MYLANTFFSLSLCSQSWRRKGSLWLELKTELTKTNYRQLQTAAVQPACSLLAADCCSCCCCYFCCLAYATSTRPTSRPISLPLCRCRATFTSPSRLCATGVFLPHLSLARDLQTVVCWRSPPLTIRVESHSEAMS